MIGIGKQRYNKIRGIFLLFVVCGLPKVGLLDCSDGGLECWVANQKSELQ
jgi:hypothetical protein